MKQMSEEGRVCMMTEVGWNLGVVNLDSSQENQLCHKSPVKMCKYISSNREQIYIYIYGLKALYLMHSSTRFNPYKIKTWFLHEKLANLIVKIFSLSEISEGKLTINRRRKNPLKFKWLPLQHNDKRQKLCHVRL